MISGIYSFKGNTNIFLDGKYIPSPIAIENYITSTVQCDSILQKINNNIVLYKEILKEYQNKFENIELQGEIS